MSLPLNHARIASSLAGQAVGREIVYFEETGSTNDEARRLAESGYPEGVAVFADSQTSGRGRRGAEWFSVPRTNLLLSVLLRPAQPPEEWPRLTHVAALAVCRAIEASAGVEAQVKWPNDVYVGGKKIAGILLESGFPPGGRAYAIIGIGLNVNLVERDLPLEIRAVTTSLRLENGGEALPRETVAIALLRALENCLAAAQRDFPALLEEVTHRSWLLNKQVRVLIGTEEITGLAAGYTASGELVLSLPGGSRRTLSSVDLIRPV